MTYDTITEFEQKIAAFYGAPYAVATDCCTHAVELALRYTNAEKASCPIHTYISIPFTFQKIGNINWHFRDEEWKDFYYVTDNIIDAAVYWKKDGYVPGTYMCLSFQFKKHLNTGRGGAILVDNEHDYIELKKLCHDGRFGEIPWAEQSIASIGYHYYMTPETAQLGLDRLPTAIATTPAKKWDWTDYPDLTELSVFRDA